MYNIFALFAVLFNFKRFLIKLCPPVLKDKYDNRILFVSAGFHFIFQLFEARPVTTVMGDVVECYSPIELTHSDGIKDTLAVERLPCALM